MVDVGQDAAGSTPGGADVVPGLYWTVRESFVRYVLGNPDGQMWGDDGLETDGEGTFRFPLTSATRTADGWRIEFSGDLRFSAHGGMLTVGIVHPVLELGAEGGVLTVEAGDGTRRPLVAVEAAEPVPIDGGFIVFPPLPTTLAADAVAMFGESYPAGSRFDPLRIAIPALEEESS